MDREAGIISEKNIERLSLYRRLLNGMLADGIRSAFSHQLATTSGYTAAQIRRDLMAVGYTGSPTTGYEIPQLLKAIREYLDAPGGQKVALVGVGNLGKALLSFFSGRRPSLQISAAFDNDAYKVNRVIHGCRCYSMESLAETAKAQKLKVAILAVPAGAAQEAAEKLIAVGFRGILNFAPVRLRTPPHVYVENIDMTMGLEKVAFFARQKSLPAEEASV
jgi:redox-sensing transcriptional repressor